MAAMPRWSMRSVCDPATSGRTDSIRARCRRPISGVRWPMSNATQCERRSSSARKSINGRARPHTWGWLKTSTRCWTISFGQKMAERMAGRICWRRPRIYWTRACCGAALMQAGHLARTRTSRCLKSSFGGFGENGASKRSPRCRPSQVEETARPPEGFGIRNPAKVAELWVWAKSPTAPLKVTVDHAPPNAILALLASIFITLGGPQGHLNSYQTVSMNRHRTCGTA